MSQVDQLVVADAGEKVTMRRRGMTRSTALVVSVAAALAASAGTFSVAAAAAGDEGAKPAWCTDEEKLDAKKMPKKVKKAAQGRRVQGQRVLLVGLGADGLWSAR